MVKKVYSVVLKEGYDLEKSMDEISTIMECVTKASSLGIFNENIYKIGNDNITGVVKNDIVSYRHNHYIISAKPIAMSLVRVKHLQPLYVLFKKITTVVFSKDNNEIKMEYAQVSDGKNITFSEIIFEVSFSDKELCKKFVNIVNAISYENTNLYDYYDARLKKEIKENYMGRELVDNNLNTSYIIVGVAIQDEHNVIFDCVPKWSIGEIDNDNRVPYLINYNPFNMNQYEVKGKIIDSE